MTAPTKHTPGPWKRDAHGDFRGADGDYVHFRSLTILCSADAQTIATAEANTALALAAPELLEIVAEVAAWTAGDAYFEDLSDRARAAIAKAEGRK